MSRKYTKKSPYWDKFSSQGAENGTLESLLPNLNESEPAFAGESFYESSIASRETNSEGQSTLTRRNLAYVGPKVYKYANIREGLLPFEHSANGYTVREAIELCQKAYANVAIFRNAIDIMSEFANAEVYLEGGSQKARDFFKKWMKFVKMWNVKDQYFREYYRSGNVFFYKINGKFELNDFVNLLQSNAAEGVTSEPNSSYPSDPNVKNQIPLQYILLNPYYLSVSRTSSWNQVVYQKILSEYELERLQNPKGEREQVILNNLDSAIRDAIKKGQWAPNGISVQLDPTNIIYSFYKKQDYEPFAVPFGFPVLDDINFKLEMKKIDQAICRTIENVILLITMGTSPDKGGINHKNIKAMQNLLNNESVGRVLVADYTTKAEFIIPDMNKVLGYEKYKIVNEDIKEGLQNILIGSEKFANTTVKAQVFFERLKESRNAFLNDFLQPEMEKIFESLGFKGSCPKARFEEVSIKDETQFNRVVTRMMELGILPPEEGLKVIETGIYPTSEELGAAQERFVQERRKGFYNPIVGGVPVIPPPPTPEGSKSSPSQKVGPPNEKGRPLGTKASVFSRAAISEILKKTEHLYSIIEKSLKTKYSKKSLSKDQKTLVENMCEAVVLGSDMESWNDIGAQIAENTAILDKLNILSPIQNLSSDYELDSYSAALLYHSSKLSV